MLLVEQPDPESSGLQLAPVSQKAPSPTPLDPYTTPASANAKAAGSKAVAEPKAATASIKLNAKAATGSRAGTMMTAVATAASKAAGKLKGTSPPNGPATGQAAGPVNKGPCKDTPQGTKPVGAPGSTATNLTAGKLCEIVVFGQPGKRSADAINLRCLW